MGSEERGYPRPVSGPPPTPPPPADWSTLVDEAEIRRRIANELRQSATIMPPGDAKVYREIADHIEAGGPKVFRHAAGEEAP